MAVTKGKTRIEGVQNKCMTFSFGLFYFQYVKRRGQNVDFIFEKTFK